VGPRWLEALVRRLEEAPGGRAVVGVPVPDAHSSFEAAAGWFTLRAFSPPDAPGPIGPAFLPGGLASYCFTKEAWRAAGGYSEDFPWGEDKTFLERLRQAGCEVVVGHDAVVRWRPRASLRALYVQYANWGRGDAMAKIDRQNELVPMALYGTGLVLAARAASGRRGSAALLAAATTCYLGLFAIAAAREVRPLRAVLWVPAIRITTDVAKIYGFLAQTLSGVCRSGRPTCPEERSRTG
jgi:hypothetical protein